MVIEAIHDAPIAAPRNDSIIDQALKRLRGRANGYKRYRDYYGANQPLTFASDKYKDAFAKMVAAYQENMCPAVIDAIVDRLVVVGFTVEGGAKEEGAVAWDIWRDNRMDLRAGEVHQEAVRCGDSYVIVWPDDEGSPRITPQDASMCTVKYDEAEHIEWAAKWWLREEDNKGRLNLYFPDRIEKYVTQNKVENGSGISMRAATLQEFEAPLANPYDRVPVFHFANNAPIGAFGMSDLRDVIPLQDALNKAVADMLVTMEFAAYPQRWATGLQVENDPVTGQPKKPWEAGQDRVWSTGDPEVKFGQFEPADLDKMLHVQDKFLTAIARVTGVPTHYLLINPSDFPSGEALKTAEARFVSKVKDRQLGFGNVWEDVLTFCLEISGAGISGQLSTLWNDPSPRSERDQAETAVIKQAIGVSDEQLQREMGYSDDQIAQMATEKEASDTASEERRLKLFDGGRIEGAA